MNYAYHYFKIIANRVEHPLVKDDCYCETHHIIPKSEGGQNTKDNLVNLTAREHYVCHLLLAKIYNDWKMWCAVTMMMSSSQGNRDFKQNSRLYEMAKMNLSQLSKGRPSPMKGKHPS